MSVICIDDYVDHKAKEIVRLYLLGKEHEAMTIAVTIPEWCHPTLEASIKAEFERYVEL